LKNKNNIVTIGKNALKLKCLWPLADKQGKQFRDLVFILHLVSWQNYR